MVLSTRVGHAIHGGSRCCRQSGLTHRTCRVAGSVDCCRLRNGAAERHRRSRGRRHRRHAVWFPEPARGIRADGARRPALVLAFGRSFAERIFHRSIHRRDCSCGRQGPRRIPPFVADQTAAPARRAGSRSGESRLGLAAAARRASRRGDHELLRQLRRAGGRGLDGCERQAAGASNRRGGGLRSHGESGHHPPPGRRCVVYGLSAALHEKITFRNGRVEQSNFDDYPMLRMDEMPRVEVHIVPSTEAPGGIGEPGLPPATPAVVNAIFAATGKRVRTLPI